MKLLHAQGGRFLPESGRCFIVLVFVVSCGDGDGSLADGGGGEAGGAPKSGGVGDTCMLDADCARLISEVQAIDGGDPFCWDNVCTANCGGPVTAEACASLGGTCLPFGRNYQFVCGTGVDFGPPHSFGDESVTECLVPTASTCAAECSKYGFSCNRIALYSDASCLTLLASVDKTSWGTACEVPLTVADNDIGMEGVHIRCVCASDN